MNPHRMPSHQLARGRARRRLTFAAVALLAIALTGPPISASVAQHHETPPSPPKIDPEYPNLAAASEQERRQARRLWRQSKRSAKRLFPRPPPPESVATTVIRTGSSGHGRSSSTSATTTTCTTDASSTRSIRRRSSTGTTRRSRWCSSPSCTGPGSTTSPTSVAASSRGTRIATDGRWSCTPGSRTICGAVRPQTAETRAREGLQTRLRRPDTGLSCRLPTQATCLKFHWRVGVAAR